MTDKIPFLDVMAAACAAQRINGRYIKRHEAQTGELSNGALMREFLHPEMVNFQVLPEDIAQAQEIVEYLNSEMVELIAGTLHNYWQTIVMLTENKDIARDDYRNAALIASVPNSYFNAVWREKAMDNLAKMQENSKHIGKIGDTFKGEVTIVSAVFSHNYNKWYHTAEIGGDLINFPFAKRLENNEKIELDGRVYKHEPHNITRLHYVRVKKTLDNP